MKTHAAEPVSTAADRTEAEIHLSGRELNGEFEATGKLVFSAFPKPPRKPVREAIELFGKIILGLAGFCYVLGVLVVSIHLRQYGLNSLTLSQLNYVTAGVWTLVPICLILLLIILFAYGTVLETTKGTTGRATPLEKDKSRGQSHKGSKKALDIIGSIGSALIILGLVAGYFSRYLGIELKWTDWLAIPVLGTFAAAAIATAIFMLTETDTYKTLGNMALGLGLAVMALLLSLWYVVLFSTHTYATIPSSTGGGSPSRVELVVASDAKQYLETVGIKFSGGQNRTDSLRLLLASDKQYVIINADGRAVSVPADVVKSVIYER